MGDILIRGVSGTTHDELKRRADTAGTSLQSYVRALLEEHTARPSLSDWLSSLDQVARHPEVRGSEAIGLARQELP